MKANRDRFKEAPWYDPSVQVTIGGLGSIGSWLTFMMSRLVDSIYVYDFDSVEAHNMSGQLYAQNHVDKPKDRMTKEINKKFNPGTKISLRGKFVEGSGVTPICFACFDSMKARKNMFESWKKLDERELFVDGRLTAEQLWVYAVTKGREKDYEEYLFSDDEVEELPCSFKSTTHISAMIASYMTTMFTNYLSNKEIEDIRMLPLETTYVASEVKQDIQL